jgi:polysaccharide export outer membrane protein
MTLAEPTPCVRRKRAAVVSAAWLLAVGLMCSMSAAADQGGQAYRLHPGDKITVGLFDDPKLLPQEITIAPDGRFSFPLIGEISASGRTVEQVRVEVETKLKKFITDPSVTLAVVDVKGNVAYVVGQVNKPGFIEMNPGINILQALSIAGGLNPYAKADSIIVIRNAGGVQSVLNFHYSQVAGGKALTQNIELESGDVVVVP